MKSLTAGESFRILLQREKIKQVDIANKTGLDRRSISQAMKNFDENKGSINTLVDYAAALGFEVEFNFKKMVETKNEI